MADVLADELRDRGVSVTTVRAVDLTIKPGVTSDAGEGDEWPRVHELLLDAKILVMASPTRVGHPSSIAQRVLGAWAR